MRHCHKPPGAADDGVSPATPDRWRDDPHDTNYPPDVTDPLPGAGGDAVHPPPPDPPAPDLATPGPSPFAGQGPATAAVAVGGALGALGRHGLDLALPARTGGLPWATFLINASGCLVIGALVVLLTEVWTAPPLTRPFLATGLLGGYTTFSTYTVQVQQLLVGGHVGTALGYLFGTLAAALAATWAGVCSARLLGGRSSGTGGVR